MQLRSDANTCFVCGPENPTGLQLTFELKDDICVSEFTPGPNHGGYENMTHGGLIFSVLDDVMANWAYLQGIRMFTAKCEIRYKAPLPVGTKVFLKGECLKQKARLMQMKGTMTRADNGEVVAETDASFMIDR